VRPEVVVVGVGEVGRPLLQLVRSKGRPALGIDLAPAALPDRGSVQVMHICFPFENPDFVGESARYIELIAPRLTIVNSTVGVGTTRAVHERTGARIAHSPIRGKHSMMLQELTRYTKYIGGIDAGMASDAAGHFRSLGVPTRVLASPEATELAKLTETTYFGLLIAWAQEVERYCDRLNLDYDEIVSFYEEIGFLPPVKYFPGVIGGHCVMPNIEILSRVDGTSPILDAIRSSNARKRSRDGTAGTTSPAASTPADSVALP
jgi:UDP-N-acetyl-D-mannosaminuronate dehydrogenase